MEWRAARSTSLSRRLMKSASSATTSTLARARMSTLNAVSRSRSVVACRISTSCPMARAAVRASRMAGSAVWLLGLTSTATTGAVTARRSRSSSSRFGQSAALITVMTVAVPPGLLKLSTRPSSTGSPEVPKTIGSSKLTPSRHVSGCQLHLRRSHPHYGGPNRLLVLEVYRVDLQPTGTRSQRFGPRRNRSPSALGGTQPPDASWRRVISHSRTLLPA